MGELLNPLEIFRSQADGARQLFGQFLCEAGAGQHADFGIVGQYFLHHLEGEQAGIQFEAFARGQDGQIARAVFFKHFDAAAQTDHGRCHQHQLAVVQRGFQVGKNVQVFGQRESRQITLVLAAFLDNARMLGIVRPHIDAVSVLGKMDTERSTPCTRADNGDIHNWFILASALAAAMPVRVASPELRCILSQAALKKQPAHSQTGVQAAF